MKKIAISLIFVFALMISLFMVSANAFELDKTDIEIILNDDGTADVTEKWTVTYSDSADYFYRDFDIYSADNAVSLIQKYGEIKDVKVLIDGEEISEGSGNNEYTFDEADDGKSYVLAIKCPSAQNVREYDISYTITEAVNKSGKDAVFSYMVIGKTFRYTSNNVAVNLVFPDGVKSSDITVADGYEEIGCEVEVTDNSAKFEKRRVYDTFSVEASCNKSFFDADSLVKYSAAAEKAGNAFQSFLKILPFILVVIAVALVILFVLLPDRLARFTIENKVKKQSKTSEENSIKIPENISACECYKIVNPPSRIKPVASAKRIPALFAMAILECIEKGYIVADGDNLIVGTPRQEVPAYITSVLNFLKTFSKEEHKKYVIDKNFAERVALECETNYDVITNYLSTFYSLVKGADLKFFMKKENREFYKVLYTVKLGASDVKKKPDFAQCVGEVLSGAKTKDPEIFSMMYSSPSPDKMFEKGGRAGEAELCEALAAMYKVFIKSK